jgi:hypothetical protein
MVSVVATDLNAFESVVHLIRRLMSERDVLALYYHSLSICGEDKEINMFVNVREVHINLIENDEVTRDWRGFVRRCDWPCGSENVTIVEPRPRQMKK